MKKKITKAQADAQAKRDKFLECAKIHSIHAEHVCYWRRLMRQSRKELDQAHRDFLAVETHLK